MVIVRKYEPNVQCGRRWNGSGDCKQVLDRLSVNTLPEVFGPPGMMGVNVITPSIWNLGQWFPFASLPTVKLVVKTAFQVVRRAEFELITSHCKSRTREPGSTSGLLEKPSTRFAVGPGGMELHEASVSGLL